MKTEADWEYEEWAEALEMVNDRINNLTVRNDYAEALQAEYDRLLAADPRKK